MFKFFGFFFSLIRNFIQKLKFFFYKFNLKKKRLYIANQQQFNRKLNSSQFLKLIFTFTDLVQFLLICNLFGRCNFFFIIIMITQKKTKKIDKYLDLFKDLKKLWNMRVTVIPIIVGMLVTCP